LSAEKEVVNFWLNRKSYFTVNNLKSGNKDIGILALKFDKGNLTKIMHVEVNCSITGLNSLPKNKKELIDGLKKNNINVMEFEDILSDVMKELKTEYFKNDVIRTLQIVKFLMISNPKKFVDVLHNNLSHGKARELLSELLNKDDVIKEFRKTNEDRLAMILKQAMIKPEKLAEMLENEVLNRRTRKPFIASLMEQKKIGKVYRKELESKKEKPLNKFFV